MANINGNLRPELKTLDGGKATSPEGMDSAEMERECGEILLKLMRAHVGNGDVWDTIIRLGDENAALRPLTEALRLFWYNVGAAMAVGVNTGKKWRKGKRKGK